MSQYFNKLRRHHPLAFVLIVAFALVLFWRGVWGLLDVLTTPLYWGANYHLYLVNFILSTAIGLVILICSDFARRMV